MDLWSYYIFGLNLMINALKRPTNVLHLSCFAWVNVSVYGMLWDSNILFTSHMKL